jgi:ribonuclease D
MEVLRSTFLETLPEIKSAIEHADYIAIDTELTGKRGHKRKLFVHM